MIVMLFLNLYQRKQLCDVNFFLINCPYILVLQTLCTKPYNNGKTSLKPVKLYIAMYMI